MLDPAGTVTLVGNWRAVLLLASVTRVGIATFASRNTVHVAA